MICLITLWNFAIYTTVIITFISILVNKVLELSAYKKNTYKMNSHIEMICISK